MARLPQQICLAVAVVLAAEPAQAALMIQSGQFDRLLQAEVTDTITSGPIFNSSQSTPVSLTGTTNDLPPLLSYRDPETGLSGSVGGTVTVVNGIYARLNALDSIYVPSPTGKQSSNVHAAESLVLRFTVTETRTYNIFYFSEVYSRVILPTDSNGVAARFGLALSDNTAGSSLINAQYTVVPPSGDGTYADGITTTLTAGHVYFLNMSTVADTSVSGLGSYSASGASATIRVDPFDYVAPEPATWCGAAFGLVAALVHYRHRRPAT